MKSSRFSMAMAIVILVTAQSASATVHNLFAFLDGLQETPPVATPGTGTATATLDDVTNTFSLSGSFQNLVGNTNNAHVHGPAPIGTPAGVMFPISFDAGVTSGNFSFNGVISAAHAQAILDGLAYINIHSTFAPGGEIRGQILPEPSSLALLGIGLVGVASRRRRRAS